MNSGKPRYRCQSKDAPQYFATIPEYPQQPADGTVEPAFASHMTNGWNTSIKNVHFRFTENPRPLTSLAQPRRAGLGVGSSRSGTVPAGSLLIHSNGSVQDARTKLFAVRRRVLESISTTGSEPGDLLIANIAHGLTGDREGTRFSGAIRIRGGLIEAIGDLEPLPGEHVVDATGTVVTPGLVNTHHHLFQSILKAVPAGMNEPLDPWLAKVPYTYWPRIDAGALRISARIGLAELALSGATSVADHHYIFTDRLDYDPAEVLFDVAGQLGLRFMLARGGMTKGRIFDDPAMPLPPVETLQQFLDGLARATTRWHGTGPMTRVAAAPTTPTFNLDPGELAEVAQEARRLGLRIHSHMSENEGYASFTRAKYGLRPIPWLERAGLLGPDVWYAHLVDCDPSEVALLAETGTGMAHCPQPNARLGSGVAPADTLFAQGGTVSIGVDGAAANEAADMGAAMYSAFSLHRATKGVEAVNPETFLHWATEGGAQVLGWDGIGRSAPGMSADIAMFDLSHPRNFGLHDPALAPVLTGAAQVRHSFVAGRPLVVDGKIPGLDLRDLATEARDTVARIATAPVRETADA